MSRPLKDVIRRRRNLCLNIAEVIQQHFNLSISDYDSDEAAKLIDTMIPLTNLEAEAEMEEFHQDLKAKNIIPKGPGLASLLKEALGYHKGTDLKIILNKAIEIINLHKTCPK